MKRLPIAGAVSLMFALGCSNFGQPAAVVEAPGTPTDQGAADVTDPEADAAAADETCCCAYREEGIADLEHSIMLRSSCESWSYECVDDAQCEAAEEPAAEEPAATPKPTTTAPARTTTTRPSTGGSMTRPGTGGTMTRPGTPSRTRPSSGGTSRPSSGTSGGGMTRPR